MWEKTYLPTTQLERVLFSAIVDDFENSIVSRMRGQKSARSRLKTLRSSFGPRPIGQITPEHVIDHVDWRLQSITGETMRKELTLFSRVFRYAMKIKKLPLRENPVVTAREEFALTKMLKPGRERDRRISDEEIDQIEAASESLLLPKIVRFIVQGFTAMRRGEISKMRREHIRGTTLAIPETKTDKPRVIPLNNTALAILESLPLRLDGWVWGIKPDSITQAFARAVKRAGLDDITIHDTRHEATSRLFEMGLEIQEVAAITGHDDWESLKRYTHPKPENIRKKLV